MSNYKESKKKLDKIRTEYTCKGDVIFTTAVQYTIEIGQETINGETWFKKAFDEIDNRHDDAEANGKYLFTTRDFEKAIIECARKIAEINTYDLMVYIQREMYLNNGLMDGEPDYKRAIELVKRCMSYLSERSDVHSYYYEDSASEAFANVGFSENELVYFGYQHLLDVEEDY